MGDLTGLVTVSLLFGLPCLWVWTRHQRKMAEMHGSADSGEVAQLRAQIARMEQRLGVLEKLATDPTARLAREIDQLRDGRQ